jgi:predicted O-methyltransferase YrrM
MRLRTFLGLKPKKSRAALPPETVGWWDGKQFSSDWTSAHIAEWVRILSPLRNTVSTVLEIGSWEGRSAIFFLEFFPRAHITCIDTFEGAPSFHEGDSKYPEQVRNAEILFDSNVAMYGDRVRKMKSLSATALAALSTQSERFDLVYIDGSHRSEDVLIDSALSWPILRDGGVLIWDDYKFWRNGDGPGPAIDAFLAANRGKYKTLHHGAQIIIRRSGA